MKVSILNLVPLRQGDTQRDAIENMIALAQKAEDLDYERYWIAEHHNSKSILSSATQILIDQTLMATKKIRVGSGGVMLPNHSPYIVAEQYGTLATLYPNRVDLGLGRAPGTDMRTAQALRRTETTAHFPEEVQELAGYFDDTNSVHAYPAAGVKVPIYILGSSTDSAHLAARLGLPYAFASHFAPDMLIDAVKIYRDEFKPSKELENPYVIVGANAYLADTNEEAERLSTTQTQALAGLVSNNFLPLQPPVDNDDQVWDKIREVDNKDVPNFGPVRFNADAIIHKKRQIAENMAKVTFIGDKASVKEQIEYLQKYVQFDELMVNSYIYDIKAQYYSYKLLKEVVDAIN
ncbi:LLM class flavin-dependent oxidoreductase [Lactobacillus sp. PV034]|uniref:LLM class flavin-dependent oxidoreductase n=1 Tax=Lactobacillus sp. PV034 TaxID=2594495 RepID=UPI00224057F4|nr:LLM class flavin-dependent oxidoreductase [Lactobacillus sp. PV034]QNQ81134.1 LLM class flavin-dependent oxidoreductase [Lactobacillus sp. PV034]